MDRRSTLYGDVRLGRLSGDNTYYDWLRKIFNRQSWQVANRMYHADDVCIAQTYIDFYNKEKNENMLKPTIARATGC